MYARRLGCGSCSASCAPTDPCASPDAPTVPSSSLWGYVVAGVLGALLFGAGGR